MGPGHLSEELNLWQIGNADFGESYRKARERISRTLSLPRKRRHNFSYRGKESTAMSGFDEDPFPGTASLAHDLDSM